MTHDAPATPEPDASGPRRPVDTPTALRREFAKSRWRRLARIATGCVFLVLGVAGLVLPLLQGVLFLAIGGALLAPDVPLARRALLSVYRRWPRIRRAVPRRFRRLGRGDVVQAVGSAEEGEGDEGEIAAAEEP